MIKKNQSVEIEITGITSEGNGVGRAENMAVFVPLTAVGDYARVKIVKVLKSYAFGILEEILRPSENRIEPDCPVFEKCGGCTFRHISYETELQIKNDFIKDAFKRIGGLNPDFEEITGCDETDYYRNKAQYPVSEQNGKAVCGFYSRRSHRIVPFTACRLQPEIFRQIVDSVIEYINENKIPAYNEEKHNGFIRHIYLRKGYHSDKIMLCIVVFNKSVTDRLKGLAVKISAEFPQIKSVLVNVNNQNTNVILGKENHLLYGSENITDIMCDNKILLSPMSFYQVNTCQAEKLYRIAEEYAELSGNETLLDLYCGAGTIGLSMYDKAKRLTGVEVIPQAIENAKTNAKINNIKNAEFICGDAGQIAFQLVDKGERPDVIIVDPPRKGCDKETLDAILKMSPERLVMISCNPATAARDCRILCDSGYVIRRIRGVDLFSRTGHVETVILLSQLKPDDVIHIDVELDELDTTASEMKPTYDDIKKYIMDKYNLKVSSLYISQIKRKNNLEVGESFNKPKSENTKQPNCPKEKADAIEDALRHFKVLR